MATEFFIKQKNTKLLLDKWHLNFFQYYLKIQTKYNQLLTNKHVQNYIKEILLKWFDLYLYLCNIYSIEKSDIYNMDEKDNALRLIFSIKVNTHVENKSAFYSTTINQE